MSALKTKQRTSTLDMTKCSIFKNLLVFAIPLACTTILQLLFNAADMVVVGQFSSDSQLAVGAIGSVGSLINLFVNFFMGLSVGATILIARYFGAKQENDMSEAIHSAILVSVISGIILTVLGIFLSEKLLLLMNTPKEMFHLSNTYLKIYFGGIISTMVYNFGSAILRAVGDTKRPLIFLAISGVANVGLNIFFVLALNMSVEGVAIATVISQTLSAFLVLLCLAREKGALKLSFKKLRLTKQKAIDILKLGIPAGLQSTMFSISNIIIQTSINSFGSITVSGHAAASSIEGFVHASMNCFHYAALSFTAQNIGAGKNTRINKAFVLAPVCAMAVGLTTGLLAYFFGDFLLRIYITDPNPEIVNQIVQKGLERMGTVSVFYFICGGMDAISGILRGAGYSLTPTLINLIGICGLRLLWIYTVFVIPAYHTINALLFSYPLSWIIVIISLLTCYFAFVRRGIKRQCEKNFAFTHENFEN